MGDKGGGTRSADWMHHLANYYHQKTAPLTLQSISRGRDILGDPESQQEFADEYIYGSPVYQQLEQETRSREPVRTTIEDQYQRAQENLISNLPSGGILSSALAGIDMDRAQALGNMEAQFQSAHQERLNRLAQSMWADEMTRAYGLATMTPSQSMSSLGAAAAAQAQSQAALNQGKWGAMGDMGQAVGSLFGLLI